MMEGEVPQYDEVILKGCSDCRIVFMIDPEWKNWDDCRECGHSLKVIYNPGIFGPDYPGFRVRRES